MSGANSRDSERSSGNQNNNLRNSSVSANSSPELSRSNPPIVTSFIDAFNQRLGGRCKEPDFPPIGPRYVK